jgi:hypothetical protein
MRLAALVLVALLPAALAWGEDAMEPETIRLGMDYRTFSLSAADPALCRDACARDLQCRAWTYVKPNTMQGPVPRCWLKNGVPAGEAQPCCVSGIVERAPANALPFPVARLSGHPWEFTRGDGGFLSRSLELLPDGRIGSYSNPNEARWGVEGATLVFYDTTGRPTTRYTTFREEGGRWVLTGTFLLTPNVTHVLRELPAPVAVVPKGPDTAPWSDSIGRALIDEWVRKVDSCTHEALPDARVDRWARVCGAAATGNVDCSADPEHPAGWDSHRYLWERNACVPYYAVLVRDYVTRRGAGASAASLDFCKDDAKAPCF